ncbi:MAG: hypothetical protein FWE88_06080 [Phycisphaerae bacterium]|nr:hypothetical protein [Phycisphaerae bacterium]
MTWTKHVAALARGALDLLLPDVCHACRRADVAVHGLCDTCHLALLKLAALDYCPRCGATAAQPNREGPAHCTLCPQPLPRFECVVRISPYVQPMRAIIRGMKYRREEALCHRMSELLAAAVTAHVNAPLDLVVPAAMHWRRRLARGHDHAVVLAAAVAKAMRLPLGHDLARIRPTPTQVSLPRTRRLANVRDAFAVAHPADIQGLRILLVDDVTTTGATANEAARTLLKAGASAVTLAVLAKADPPRAYAEPIE